MSYQAAVTAPHYLATQAGERILQQGGNAIEACIAMASALTVVYPHMTSLGGDGFWLIHRPGNEPIALNAAGKAAADLQHVEFGQHQRGAKSALTTAGAVAGWQTARERFAGSLSLQQIFAPAIEYAEQGFKVTETLHHAMVKLAAEYPGQGLETVFFNQGQPYQQGEQLRLPALARTYRALAEKGLQEWNTGSLARDNADFLTKAGSPIRFADIQTTKAKWCQPLRVSTQWGDFYNLGAPTQGGASLNIIGLLDQMVLSANQPQDFWNTLQGEEYALHHLVESVKVAFAWRNARLSDAEDCDHQMRQRLTQTELPRQYQAITPQAAPWPTPGPIGDTVWMGVVDQEGLAVSYIQSLYWEFGSGLVDPDTGVVWNNRCLGFNQDPSHPNAIAPNRQPMHTLNPPMALLSNGERLVYGTMGGEGQPQTQAAIIWRYLIQQMDLQSSLAAPRWLLGKTWGKSEDNLKVGESLFRRFGQQLLARGHDAVAAPDMAEFFGHAGAIHIADQQTHAASDPRSDGKAIVIPTNDNR
ncbi:gamma-glutamyltransferase family protein [Vibrio sinaloensis]|uniref:gamma-glutamyltransferase family protein n=1 Tax=Photobacterium sp. (strain ATCC 43367) TaxID=379097 RepID=UPI002044F246|nr:gamma-glutamyltransferase [Vibrio sinaloensis]UPQ89336.1 gamma-glutamyltransferase family protein [Vibrio sinaloensis]